MLGVPPVSESLQVKFRKNRILTCPPRIRSKVGQASAAKEYGWIINERKTKYVEVKERTIIEENEIKIKVNEHKFFCFEKIRCVEYLSVTIINKNKEQTEIEKRMAKGSRTWGGLRKIFDSKIVSRATKI